MKTVVLVLFGLFAKSEQVKEIPYAYNEQACAPRSSLAAALNDSKDPRAQYRTQLASAFYKPTEIGIYSDSEAAKSPRILILSVDSSGKGKALLIERASGKVLAQDTVDWHGVFNQAYGTAVLKNGNYSPLDARTQAKMKLKSYSFGACEVPSVGPCFEGDGKFMAMLGSTPTPTVTVPSDNNTAKEVFNANRDKLLGRTDDGKFWTKDDREPSPVCSLMFKTKSTVSKAVADPNATGTTTETQGQDEGGFDGD